MAKRVVVAVVVLAAVLGAAGGRVAADPELRMFLEYKLGVGAFSEAEQNLTADVHQAARPAVPSLDVSPEYARMCAQWRADSEYRHADTSPRSQRAVFQQGLADLDHYITTRCAPRGL